MNLGLFLYRIRSYTPLPLFALALIFGTPTLGSIMIGATVCLIGEAWRFWGIRTAGALTRMQAAPGGDVLVTNGPYARVRNPIYCANIVIYTGVGLMAAEWWITLVAIVWFVGQYIPIILEEERYLVHKFGDRYLEYRRNVSRFIPRVSPYVEASPDTTPVWRHPRDIWRSERSTMQAIIAATVIMTLLAMVKA